MGLGLFIAKTLLERTGAEVSFANSNINKERTEGMLKEGAIVQVLWPQALLQVADFDLSRPLPENTKN